MKTQIRLFLAFAVIVFATTNLKSQDTLFMKNGEKIASQILEISSSEIKYKKADNPDGPLFITKTAEINYIKYKNGNIETLKSKNVEEQVVKVVEPPAPKDPYPPIYTAGPFYKCDGQRMKERDMHEIIKKVNDAELNLHIKNAKQAKALSNIGFVAIPTLIFGVGYSLYAIVNNEFNGIPVSYAPGIISGIVGAGSVTVGIVYKSKRRSHNNTAINVYNQKY